MKANRPGSMMTAGFHPSIYCPKCGKPAFRVEYGPKTGTAQYLHFTKRGVKRHSVTLEAPQNGPPGGTNLTGRGGRDAHA